MLVSIKLRSRLKTMGSVTMSLATSQAQMEKLMMVSEMMDLMHLVPKEKMRMQTSARISADLVSLLKMKSRVLTDHVGRHLHNRSKIRLGLEVNHSVLPSDLGAARLTRRRSPICIRSTLQSNPILVRILREEVKMGPYCSSLLQDAPVQDHRVHPYILVRCHRSHQMVQGRDHSHLNNLDHPIHLLGLVHVRRILRCILGLDPVILNLDPLTHRSGLGRAPHTLQLTRVPVYAV